jgi:osomolarity two-component system phosphorelay intermediate protein YPD1
MNSAKHHILANMAPTTTTKTKAVEDPPKETPPPKKLSEMSEVIDKATFDQILEMDDDEDMDFSKGIVYGFFDQAETTFEKMDKALEDKNLDELSSLGHFLKGSSATLGLKKVKDHCEKIQHYGAGKDETGTVDEPDEEKSLKHIKETLVEVKKDYKEVEQFLRSYYGETKSPEVTSPSSK